MKIITSPFLSVALALTCFTTVGLTQKSEAQAELQVNPGEDLFVRLRQFYNAATQETDWRSKEDFYRRCIPLCKQYLRGFPNHKNTEATSYYLGESYYQVGEVKVARAMFKKLIAKYKVGSYVAASAFRLAHDSYSKSDFDLAAKYYGITGAQAKNAGDKNKALFNQAQSLVRAGKSAQALAIYGAVSNAKGENPHKKLATLSYGKLLLSDNKFKKSLAAFEKLLVPNQDEETKAEAAYYCGVNTIHLGDAKKAERFYKLSLNSNSKKWKGHAQTGLMGIRFGEGDFDAIIKLNREGTFELTPKLKAKQGVMVGSAYYMKKEYANAIGYFQAVEKNDPGTETAFQAGYKKLLCFYNTKSPDIPKYVDTFLERYAVGRGKHKFIHQALLMKAEVLFGKNNFKEASQAYASINSKLIDDKYLKDLMYKRGCALSKVENHAGAANAFTAFIDAFPEADEIITAYILRASSYAKLDDKGRALRDFDKVIELSGNAKSKNRAIALQRSGQLQMINKKYADMAQRFDLLLKDYPDLPAKTRAASFYMMGRGLFKDKKYKEGLKAFDQSLVLDPATFAQQIGMYRVVGNFTLREVKGTAEAIKQAEDAGIQKKIPLNAYRWLGGEYYNQEEFKIASDYLRKGVERGKPEATPIAIWRILSKAQRKAGLNQDAFLTVSILVEQLKEENDKPKLVDALLDKAKIEVALGKNGDSKNTASEALDMNPTGNTKAELVKIVADFYYIIGDHKEAANYYVGLVESADELEFHPLILDRLAKCLEKQGNSKEAKRYEVLLKKTYPRYKREKL